MIEREVEVEKTVSMWLQENIREVAIGNSSACTVLAYDLRGGKRMMMAPPLHLPTGEGPFSRNERETAFKTVLKEAFGVRTEKELEEYLNTIKVATGIPGRIKGKESHWDIMEWDFPTSLKNVRLFVERYQDSWEVLGESWHLKRVESKSIKARVIGRLKRALELDLQYWPTR